MLERVTHNASGDVYTDADQLRPALCEAVQCLNVSWPKDNVIQLPIAIGTDTATDTLLEPLQKQGAFGSSGRTRTYD